MRDLSQLERLKPLIDDDMISRFIEIKRIKKQQLCGVINKREGFLLNPAFIFDVQVKRMHEYKRQLMNAFSVAHIYFMLKDGRLPAFTPTAFIFGAKAAPGYYRAKGIIKYINELAAMINADRDVRDKMQVVFVQN